MLRHAYEINCFSKDLIHIFMKLCREYQAETCLIITINDTSIGDLPLIITISDTCKNQTKRLDSDNTINLSALFDTII